MNPTIRNIAAALSLVAAATAPQAAFASTTKWITLHNKTSTPITAVRFAEPRKGTPWSKDFLGSDVIKDNQEYKLYVNSQTCVVDIQVHYENSPENDGDTLRLHICKASHLDGLPKGLVVAY